MEQTKLVPPAGTPVITFTQRGILLAVISLTRQACKGAVCFIAVPKNREVLTELDRFSDQHALPHKNSHVARF